MSNALALGVFVLEMRMGEHRADDARRWQDEPAGDGDCPVHPAFVDEPNPLISGVTALAILAFGAGFALGVFVMTR